MLKWLLVAGAVAYLVREGLLSGDKFAFASSAPWWLVAGVAISLAVTAGLALRFHLLLRLLGQPSNLWEQIRLFFLGLFPSQVGSLLAFDAMRVVVLRKAGMSGGMIGGALLAERLIGFLALLFPAFACLLLFLDIGGARQSVLLAVLAVAAVPCCFVAWRYAVASGRWPRLVALPGSALAASLGDAMLLLWRKPANMLALFAMSLIMQFSQLAVIYFAGNCLASVELSFFETITGGALASLTFLVPLPAGGVGVGEGVFGAIIAAARGYGNAADFAPVYLLYRLLSLSVSVLSWLWFAVRTKGKERDSETGDRSGMK